MGPWGGNRKASVESLVCRNQLDVYISTRALGKKRKKKKGIRYPEQRYCDGGEHGSIWETGQIKRVS